MRHRRRRVALQLPIAFREAFAWFHVQCPRLYQYESDAWYARRDSVVTLPRLRSNTAHDNVNHFGVRKVYIPDRFVQTKLGSDGRRGPLLHYRNVRKDVQKHQHAVL